MKQIATPKDFVVQQGRGRPNKAGIPVNKQNGGIRRTNADQTLKYIFQCEYCSRQSVRKADMEKHERTHTNERPYECAVCKKKFSQSSHLRTHERKVHKLSSQNTSDEEENPMSLSEKETEKNEDVSSSVETPSDHQSSFGSDEESYDGESSEDSYDGNDSDEEPLDDPMSTLKDILKDDTGNLQNKLKDFVKRIDWSNTRIIVYENGFGVAFD